MTDSQLTPEQIATAQMEETAKSIATAQMEKMKEELASNILGKEKVAPPKDWGEVALKGDLEKIASSAEEKAYARLQREKKAEDDRVAASLQMTAEQKQVESKKEWEQMSAEWKDAVDDGYLPRISEEVSIKIAAGAPLTPEDKKDPGLVAFNDVVTLHADKRRKGETSSLYRTIQKFYNQKPSGAVAPVFGGRPAVSQSSAPSYDEIHELGERMRRRR